MPGIVVVDDDPPLVFRTVMPAGQPPDGLGVVTVSNAFKSVAAEAFAVLWLGDAALTTPHWLELVDQQGRSNYHGWQDLPMGRVDSRLTPQKNAGGEEKSDSR